MDAKIDTVAARGKLKPRHDPYWHRISRGLQVGFRKMTADSAGAWVVSFRDGNKRRARKSLGALDQYPPSDRFDRAVDAARKWQNSLPEEMTVPRSRPDVYNVCLTYVEKIRDEKGDVAAAEIAARFTNWVKADPIGTIAFEDLKSSDVKAWRQRMVNTPVRGLAGKPRKRSLDTVNRDMAPVRAAFNYALLENVAGNDQPWRLNLKAFKKVSKRRTIYLDRQQRENLIRKSTEDFATFATALCILPARPGALANLKVGSFESRLDVLTIGKDKSGEDRKIMLPKASADFIRKVVANRPPDAPLFVRECGLPWEKDSWKRHLRRASLAANLPTGTVLMSLRHSTITDMVHHGVDLLTVAQIAGTSVAMIEKHYGHLRPLVAVQALTTLII